MKLAAWVAGLERRALTQYYIELNGNLVPIIKEKLSNDQAVVLSFPVPVFDSWYHDGYVESTGEINLPIAFELADPKYHLGNHAVCLVGYEDQGQTFSFKNSWGTGWGANNSNSPGYGQLPYNYLGIGNYYFEVYSLLP
ncbi:MAG: hypothetical protein HY730_09330 [Candidatus Tectomicrobia bacterium]|uniref:Peptidase C1A papain C-terminal domain-containing protein n=1 Tax=Tectimicrobiota bacterium TaxID=2528274 RepID=A0A933GMB8_UNCTE|nr:hypothetical protein [Candidatus Tectomicrobia bacterium]